MTQSVRTGRQAIKAEWTGTHDIAAFFERQVRERDDEYWVVFQTRQDAAFHQCIRRDVAWLATDLPSSGETAAESVASHLSELVEAFTRRTLLSRIEALESVVANLVVMNPVHVGPELPVATHRAEILNESTAYRNTIAAAFGEAFGGCAPQVSISIVESNASPVLVRVDSSGCDQDALAQARLSGGRRVFYATLAERVPSEILDLMDFELFV